MPSSILITAAGSMAVESVCEALSSTGHTLIGTDIYPRHWVGVDALFHSIHKVPKAQEPNYIPMLLSLCKQHNVHHIFPLTDAEVDVLSAQRDQFTAQGIQLCLSPSASISLMRDKLAMAQLHFPALPVDTIPTVTREHIHTLAPAATIVAKLQWGRSSQGLRFCAHAQEALQCQGEYIFQNFIDGDIYVVDYIRDTFGNDHSAVRKELLRTSHGAGLSVHMLENPILSAAASHLGKILHICGTVNFEFIYHNEQYYLMDCNPRFSAGIAFSQMTGFDFINNHYACFCQKKLHIPAKLKTNFYAVKRFTTYATEEKPC